MKKITLFCSLLLLICVCHAQEEIAKNKPNERWTVNKEMDENGNIIRMDSTYVWSYASGGEQLSQKQLDSIMQQFEKGFSMEGFDDFFEFDRDSTFQSPFSKGNFFSQEFIDPQQQMQQMMRMADSLQQMYFKKSQPNKNGQKL